jgi:drug/metabolite transporter (DMT)-like permease
MSVLCILFSVFVFSLWALLAVFGIESVNRWEFIFWTELLSFAASAALLWVSAAGAHIRARKLTELSRREILEFCASGLSLILAQACLLTSFLYLSKAGAMIIYEVWPIFAMYLTPLLVAKAWPRVSPRDLMFAMLALFGVSLIMLPERGEPFFLKASSLVARYGTLLLPLAGGALNALSSVLKARLSQRLDIKGHPLISVLVAQVFYGIFGTGFAAAALALSRLFDHQVSRYTPLNIGGMLFISLVVYTAGRLSYVVGLLRSKHSNITVLWYLTPILTVLWLWLAGYSAVTTPIVLGSCFIIGANLLMSVKADDSLSYPAAIVTLLCVGTYCHFVKGLDMGDYYQAISVPLVFYAILVAFLVDRLDRRDAFEEGLAVEIIRHIGLEGPASQKKQRELVEQVAAVVRTSDVHEIDEHYRALRNSGHEFLRRVSDKLDALALSRIQGANFGEMLVLSLVGLLTVGTTVVFRPPVFVADCFAVVLSAAMVFIYFMIYDLIRERARFYLELDERGQFGLSASALHASRFEIVLSTGLLVIIIAATIGALWFGVAR